MRDLLKSTEPRAAQAVDLFIHRICRELGSLTAALEGLDGLVFTAGIGEHSPEVRKGICDHFGWLGIKLDDQANTNNHSGLISALDSKIQVHVIPTNEELMIALAVEQVLNG